ncbi:DUF6282 family protein [Thermodesulfobacteriota bacterium]
MAIDNIYPAKMETIERLMKGSIDMHLHPGPHQTPRSDALTVARQAQEVGMKAIVLKSRSYSSAPLASIVTHAVPDILVLGGLVLDHEAGGLNPYAVEAAISFGAKIIWMPVFCAADHLRRHGADEQGITVLQENGKLLPVVYDILGIIRDKDVVLATGHLSKKEISALVTEARQVGIKKILVTHATEPGIGLTIEEQQNLVNEGAIMEHCLFACLPYFTLTKFAQGNKVLEPKEIARAVKAVGAEHCILSTDSGGPQGPSPPEAMRMFISMMLACGLSEEELALMVKIVPTNLLNLK